MSRCLELGCNRVAVAIGHRSGEKALIILAVERMKGVYALRVPLDVDTGVGVTWREAH